MASQAGGGVVLDPVARSRRANAVGNNTLPRRLRQTQPADPHQGPCIPADALAQRPDQSRRGGDHSDVGADNVSDKQISVGAVGIDCDRSDTGGESCSDEADEEPNGEVDDTEDDEKEGDEGDDDEDEGDDEYEEGEEEAEEAEVETERGGKAHEAVLHSAAVLPGQDSEGSNQGVSGQGETGRGPRTGAVGSGGGVSLTRVEEPSPGEERRSKNSDASGALIRGGRGRWEILVSAVSEGISVASAAATVGKNKPETASRRTAGVAAGVAVNTESCRYEVVRACCRRLGMRVVDGSSTPWGVMWLDTGVSVQRVLALEPYQRINHFPGMHEICRKDCLARNLGLLARALPSEYDFFPRTFVLPHDWAELHRAVGGGAKRRRHDTYIAKPSHGCQGKGIFLFRGERGLAAAERSGTLAALGGGGGGGPVPLIVQQYVKRPLLVDGRKSDLRVYVLVTSAEPLRVFMHRCGLARLATVPYERPRDGNVRNVKMHLTNYAINKNSESTLSPRAAADVAASRSNRGREVDKVGGTDDGPAGTDAGLNARSKGDDDRSSSSPKRPMTAVFEMLEQRYGTERAARVWDRMVEVIVKTVLMVQPQIRSLQRACMRTSQTTGAPSEDGAAASSTSSTAAGKRSVGGVQRSQCFEILGFDILLDQRLRPWVIEVNHSPSFTCDSKLDSEVKSRVIGDALGLLDLRAATDRRRYKREERRRAHSRLFGGVGDGGAGVRSSRTGATSNTIPATVPAETAGAAADCLRTSQTGPEAGNDGGGLKSSARDLSPASRRRLAEFRSNTAACGDAALAEFEDTHMGLYLRVFPPMAPGRERAVGDDGDVDNRLLAKYLKCLESAQRLLAADGTDGARLRGERARKRYEGAAPPVSGPASGRNSVATQKISIGGGGGSDRLGVALSMSGDKPVRQERTMEPRREPLNSTRSGDSPANVVGYGPIASDAAAARSDPDQSDRSRQTATREPARRSASARASMGLSPLLLELGEGSTCLVTDGTATGAAWQAEAGGAFPPPKWTGRGGRQRGGSWAALGGRPAISTLRGGVVGLLVRKQGVAPATVSNLQLQQQAPSASINSSKLLASLVSNGALLPAASGRGGSTSDEDPRRWLGVIGAGQPPSSTAASPLSVPVKRGVGVSAVAAATT
ncbi:Tubulin polyglutamylase ttll6, partial [Cladochytrium tenue]